MAILYQTYFHPLHGFNQNDKINKFIATTPLDYGKIVTPDENGVLHYANDYGYFLGEHVTEDGASVAETVLGIPQYEKRASDKPPVGVWIGKKGNIVRTRWVEKGEVDIAVGVKVNISNGVYVTATNGTKGVIKQVFVDSLGNTLYDVEIL